MNENNLENVTSLSSDLSTRENITIQLEELLVAGNYDEAKLLLEPSQPEDIADAIGSLPLILQALAFRLLKKNEANTKLNLFNELNFFSNSAIFII